MRSFDLARAAAVCLLLLSEPALAAGSTAPGIVQSGAVTAGHCAQFSAAGVAIDSGASCGTGTAGVTQAQGTAAQVLVNGDALSHTGATTISLPANIIPPGTVNGNTVPSGSDTFTLNGATQTLTNKSIAGSEINSGTIPAAQLPPGSSTAFGAVKVDGTTIGATAGVISVIGGGSSPCSAFGTTTGTCLQGAGALGTPSSGVATNLTGLPISTGVIGLGSGVAAALAITHDTSGGICTVGGSGCTGGGSVSVTSASPNIVITPSPGTGTFTVGSTYAINAQSGTTYTVLSTDMGKLVTFSNSSAIAVTLPVATTSGFTTGASFDVQNIGAGAVTITPTTSTINGASTLVIPQNMGCSVTSDGTNYQVSACAAAGTLPVSKGGTGITAFGTGVATALGTNVSGTGAICLASGSACSGSGSSLTVGTTTISSGTNGNFETNNSGVLGEKNLFGGTNAWTAQQSNSITTLSISTATFTPDGSNNNYKLTLVHASCPCTLANPSVTPVAGTSGVIEVIQSSTGSDAITTWGSDYIYAGGTSTIAFSSGASVPDFLSYYVIDSTHILLSTAALNATH